MNKPTMLTEAQCKEITTLRPELSWEKIGGMFGVSRKTVQKGYNWYMSRQAEVVVDELPEEPVVFQESQVQDEYDALISGYTICIINRTQNESVFVDQSSPNYDTIVETIRKHIFDSDVSTRNEYFAKCFELAQPKKMLEKLIQGRVVYNPETNTVVDEKGFTLPESLVNKIIDVINKAQDTEASAWMKFTDKLLQNPSNRAVRELYGFLAAKDIKINEDGDVVCYKKVRSNYKDIHSGTFDNSPGTEPRVERNMVDEDSNQTCSYGLHVCSKSYLPHFGSRDGGDRVVEVLVHPADFVAIPADYNSSKCRVVGYKVTRDVTDLI